MASDKPDLPAGVSSPASSIDSFLDAARSLGPLRAGEGGGRLAFALDATASRQPTWDLACALQAEMFDVTAGLGGLKVQLVYYRGADECRSSPYVADTRALGRLMGQIACQGGRTQIGRVLRHLQGEAERSGLKAAVFVGDAMEEDAEALLLDAGRLGVHGVRLFVFQEGNDPHVERTFREMARLTGGAWCRFDAGAANELRTLLRAVATYAAGGQSALLTSRDAGAKRLIAAMGR
ncbi:VWA domain-containing protein [Azorhizobium sp. AG788]|uniref:VWA domain-containing protein n=1 Tax=Azorhizobium sp. AG788 TaxID=2183897 RepID=UPI0031393092